MMSIARYQDIHRYVGNTPLIRLRRLSRRLGKGSCVRLDLGLFIATGRVRFTADVSWEWKAINRQCRWKADSVSWSWRITRDDTDWIMV